MRFFINSHPWNLKNELRCYKAPNEIMLEWCVVLSKFEVKYAKGFNGPWSLGAAKLKLMQQGWKEQNEYEYAGCLGEQDKASYRLTFYYYKYHQGHPVEIPLPSKKELRRLGLVQHA